MGIPSLLREVLGNGGTLLSFFPFCGAIFPEGRNLNDISHLDPIFQEPSAIDLQGILGRISRIVNPRTEGLQELDIDNFAPAVEERNGEGEGSVLHPKGENLFLIVHEKHPFIPREISPKHQAAGLFFIRSSDLNPKGLSLEDQPKKGFFHLFGEGDRRPKKEKAKDESKDFLEGRTMEILAHKREAFLTHSMALSPVFRGAQQSLFRVDSFHLI